MADHMLSRDCWCEPKVLRIPPPRPKPKPPSGKPLYVPSLGLIYRLRRLWSRVSRASQFGGREVEQ